MKKLWLAVLCISILYIQCKEKSAELPATSKTTEVSFPNSWLGSWQGPLIIDTGKENKDSIMMNFNVQLVPNSDTLVWQLQYGEQETRDYRLIPLKNNKNSFVIDEQNSIKINAKLFGQKLVSFFDVQSSAIAATYEMYGEEIIFEIMMYNKEGDTTISGNTMYQGEAIPEVKSYQPVVFQRAMMKKINVK